jgi:hypothetical protein
MLGKNLIGFMIGGAVRKSLLQKISRRWNIGNACIFDITESSILEVENKLYEIILNSIPSQ